MEMKDSSKMVIEDSELLFSIFIYQLLPVPLHKSKSVLQISLTPRFNSAEINEFFSVTLKAKSDYKSTAHGHCPLFIEYLETTYVRPRRIFFFH